MRNAESPSHPTESGALPEGEPALEPENPKGFLAGGRPLSLRKKEKADLNSLLFWSGLREQIKTVDNCFYRSECAETRSNGSEACLTSRTTMFQALEPENPKGFLAGVRPYPLQNVKKRTLFSSVLRFGADYVAR